MAQTGTVEVGQLDPEILRWAQHAKFAWLACRDVRHAWPADMNSLQWREEIHQGRRVWVRQAACMHDCGVVRVQRRDQQTGERYNRYEYPLEEGDKRSLYLLPPGVGALNADDIFALQMVLAGTVELPKPRRGRRR